ncbi:MAG TPA: hypothetical protein VG738_05945 [Chitinophagaceae bacterium]|nr:hypothetical protein [Chitinophagaceae bacterium]
MKKKTTLGTIAALGFFALIFTTSCNKDASSGSSSTNTTVTEQDAADAITEAVTPESAGLSAQVNDATVIATSNAFTCGTSYDSSIARSSASGAAISYSFTLAWNWKLSCTSPANFTASFNGHTTYDAPRISSNDSSNGSFVITGLAPADNAYTFNSTYVRNGSEQSKVNNKNSFTSKITITSSNITVDKVTQEITGGTAAATISGESSSGKSFSFSGNITFNGNKKATLQITGGASYNISW